MLKDFHEYIDSGYNLKGIIEAANFVNNVEKEDSALNVRKSPL